MGLGLNPSGVRGATPREEKIKRFQCIFATVFEKIMIMGGGSQGDGVRLAALDKENEEAVVAAGRKARRASMHVMHARTTLQAHATSHHARLTTRQAVHRETPGKCHSRICDFSVATPTCNGQAQLHSQTLP